MCVSWSTQPWNSLLSLLRLSSSQEVLVEWVSISIHQFKAEMKVMLLDLGVDKKTMILGPRGPFFARKLSVVYLHLFSLFSPWEEDENESRRQCSLCGLFG